MGELVPDTDRERLYTRWYDLTVLYHEAVRHRVDPSEAEATKTLAYEAWDAYVASITAVVPSPPAVS
jgi:hypothetical protein